MSSLRNSLHRRNHKERSQLSQRAKLGILEKHKDYVLRARDYHSKKERLQQLKQKAQDRNKDEFYFGMTRQRTKDGVHMKDRGNSALPVDMVKVLKSQDENYIRTMRASGQKKIDRVKAQLTAMADLFSPGDSKDSGREAEGLNEEELQVLREADIMRVSPSERPRSRAKNHIVFVDSEQDAKIYASSSSANLNDSEPTTAAEDEEDYDLGWISEETTERTKRRRTLEIGTCDSDSSSFNIAEAAQKHRTRLLRELSARLIRERQLRYAERELELQRLLMGKGASKKLRGVERVDGGEEDDVEDDDFDSQRSRRPSKTVDVKTYKPRVYKWRTERKK